MRTTFLIGRWFFSFYNEGYSISMIALIAIVSNAFRFLFVFLAIKNQLKKLHMKQIKLVLLFFVAIGFANCNGDDPIEEQTPKILINELLPKNTQYGSDQDGEFDDCIFQSNRQIHFADRQ